MPRMPRIEYAGAVYHIMNRGDHREPIFLDDIDRLMFLRTLGEACEKTGWQIHALVLMDNHFHTVTETPQPNLVVGMHWLLGTYTSRFNRRHELTGHLFGGRYKAIPIDTRSPGYLLTACEYVHLNPDRPGLVPPEQPLQVRSRRGARRISPRTGGTGCCARGTPGPRSVKVRGLEREGPARNSEGTPGQGSDRGPTATRDAHEAQVDCDPAEHRKR
jgi:REP element-mobilizing transposase RayT